MGLDSFWTMPEQKNAAALQTLDLPEADKLSLCGGLFSGHGSGSFRGKVYDDVVRRITGVSLYQENISNEDVKKMADALEKADFARAGWEDTENRRQEFSDLQKMFRLYADAGAELKGWW